QGSNNTLTGGQVVNGATTTVAVASSLNPSTFGQAVTFSATVTSQNGGTVGGTADLKIDGNTVQSGATVSNGRVSFNAISTLTVTGSPHSVQVVYNGDSNNQGSNNTLTNGQAVSMATTSLTVASSVNPSTFGQAVTFSATVTSQFGGVVGGTADLKI